VDPVCTVTTSSKQQLSSEQENLISTAKRDVHSVEMEQSSSIYANQIRSAVVNYSTDGVIRSSASGNNQGHSTFTHAGFEAVKYDDNNLSLMTPDMPMNVERIFLSSGVVTFVYRDGRVLMKPRNCMTAEEEELSKQARVRVIEEEKRFRREMDQSMNDMREGMRRDNEEFRRQMDNMRSNLEESMRKMRERLRNMFG